MRRRARDAYPSVWVVDDFEPNRAKFRRDHHHEFGGAFDVRLFAEPADVLAALRTETPDALLCDIYFYEADEVEEAERKFNEMQKELAVVGDQMDAPRHAVGVTLIEEVYRRAKGKPAFPVYAYTGKGPYVLQSDGFERLTHVGVRWLFKGKIAPLAEQVRLEADIQEARDLGLLLGWRKRFASYAIQITKGSGLLGAVVSVALDRLVF